MEFCYLAVMEQAFGTHLKSWREKRRLSQLQLASQSEVSARHIAFLETGRSQPSRAMVLRLARHLEVPLAMRNNWLTAAGYSVQFRKRALDDREMRYVEEALDHLLQRHDPFPGFMIDRHWTLRKVNRSATLLLGALGLALGDSLLDALSDPERVAAVFENGDEICAHLAMRLRTESTHFGGDPVLDQAVARLSRPLRHDEPLPASAVIPARIRTPEGTLSLMTMLASFGATNDLAVAEYRVELMYPADETTRSWLLSKSPS